MNPRAKPEPPTARPDDWTRCALCANPEHDPDMWFPRHDRQATAAKQVCYRCPVIKDCDRYIHALPRYERHGVWAGIYYRGDAS